MPANKIEDQKLDYLFKLVLKY